MEPALFVVLAHRLVLLHVLLTLRGENLAAFTVTTG